MNRVSIRIEIRIEMKSPYPIPIGTRSVENEVSRK
jgi:hypothetical protein